MQAEFEWSLDAIALLLVESFCPSTRHSLVSMRFSAMLLAASAALLSSL